MDVVSDKPKAKKLTQSHSTRNVFHIHPEADPRDDDDENCWNVGLNKMETDAPIQVKFGSQTTIVSHDRGLITSFSNDVFDHKLWHFDFSAEFDRLVRPFK